MLSYLNLGYYGNEAKQYNFYRNYHQSRYKGVSIESRVPYDMLLEPHGVVCPQRSDGQRRVGLPRKALCP